MLKGIVSKVEKWKVEQWKSKSPSRTSWWSLRRYHDRPDEDVNEVCRSARFGSACGDPGVCGRSHGDWEFALKILNEVSYVRGTWKTAGERVSGNVGLNTIEGATRGDEVTFRVTRPNGQSGGEFTGRLAGSEMKGTAVVPGFPVETTWTARRQAKRPEKSQMHQFEPTEFHRVFSGDSTGAPHLPRRYGENVDGRRRWYGQQTRMAIAGRQSSDRPVLHRRRDAW